MVRKKVESPPEVKKTLEITLIAGKLYRNTEFFGTMDPFIELVHNGKSYKTEVCEDGGKKPKWNETITIPNVNLEDKIKIRCLDEDFVSNDLVGEHTYTIQDLCPFDTVNNDWFTLFYKKKKSADINIESKITKETIRKNTN